MNNNKLKIMQKHSLFIFLFILGFGLSNSNAQTAQQPDSLGLPGDNLNLYAVMKLFQSSETLEGFEKSLNSEDSKINNLDLNNDNKIDYIKVIDNVDKQVHNIVLQVPVNEKENQDVATFIVEKNSKGEVQIQLIGDEELYGKNYVVEPNYTDSTAKTETPNPGYVKQSSTQTTDSKGNTTIINNYTTTQTASWPVVSYMFMPTYVVWVSPWRYGYYPSYWNPWTPWYWQRYYGYHYNYGYYYYGNYRYCNYYRNPVAYNNYYSRRSVSVTCNVNIRNGGYRGSYSHPESRSMGNKDFERDSKKNRDRGNNGNDNTKIKNAGTKNGGNNISNQQIQGAKQKAANGSNDRSMPSRQNQNIDRKPVDRAPVNRASGRVGGRRP